MCSNYRRISILNRYSEDHDLDPLQGADVEVAWSWPESVCSQILMEVHVVEDDLRKLRIKTA